jgi:hypothetical protein
VISGGTVFVFVRSRIALTILLLATLPIETHGVRQATPAGAAGTLVSFVPANGALLIAADSRSTTLGVQCDGRAKLAVPANPPFTIIAGTGTSEWITARFPLWPDDPCGDIAKNGVTFLDAKGLALKYLEQKMQPIWLLDLKDFADYINKAIIGVAQQNPTYVRQFAGKTMFQIVLGAFDPKASTSYVRAIQFNLTDGFVIEVKPSADHKYANGDTPDYPHFGDTITFTTHVMRGVGARHLPTSLEQINSKTSIADVSVEQASDLAVNLIEAAKLTAAEVPELNSIGGPVVAYKIDAGGIQRIR